MLPRLEEANHVNPDLSDLPPSQDPSWEDFIENRIGAGGNDGEIPDNREEPRPPVAVCKDSIAPGEAILLIPSRAVLPPLVLLRSSPEFFEEA